MQAWAWGIWLGLPTLRRKWLQETCPSFLNIVSVHFNIASVQNTLIFLPQTRIPFIWSRASCAASGCSNSTKAKPCRRKISFQANHLFIRDEFQLSLDLSAGHWKLNYRIMNLVFASHSVPTHCDRTNRSKRQKRRLYRVFLGVVVDAANIDPERDFALKIEFQRRIKFHLLMIDTACCRCRYFVCCCWWAIVCFIKTSFIDTWEVKNLLSKFVATRPLLVTPTSIAYFLALWSRAPCSTDNLGRPIPKTPLF